jgi:hypothetical protein
LTVPVFEIYNDLQRLQRRNVSFRIQEHGNAALNIGFIVIRNLLAAKMDYRNYLSIEQI